MLVMGIDHGTKITGYGFLEMDLETKKWTYVDHGFIRETKVSYPLSLFFMADQIRRLIRDIQPNLIIFEGPKSMRGFKAHQALVELLGCLKGVAIQCNKPYIEIEPTSMKSIVAGNGWASKEEVARSVSTILKIPYEELVGVEYYKTGSKKGQVKKYILDGTDALALALALPDYYKRFRRIDYKGVGNDL